jgi:FkbM family methyltransferase
MEKSQRMNPLASREKELVRAFFSGRPTGFFVEVGANEPDEFSQTWHLEQRGWRGVLVEPQASCCERLRQQRRNSVVFQVACSAPEKAGEAVFHVSNASAFSSLERHVDDPSVVYERSERVKVVTLDQILEGLGNPEIDFVSIDVEGTELDVLRGFNLARYRPTLILLEDKVHDLAKHSYLKKMGYKLVRRTGFNNWYVPKGYPFAPVSLIERLKLFRKMYAGTPWRKAKLMLKRWRANAHVTAGR